MGPPRKREFTALPACCRGLSPEVCAQPARNRFVQYLADLTPSIIPEFQRSRVLLHSSGRQTSNDVPFHDKSDHDQGRNCSRG
jgi:hypothetical protein